MIPISISFYILVVLIKHALISFAFILVLVAAGIGTGKNRHVIYNVAAVYFVFAFIYEVSVLWL